MRANLLAEMAIYKCQNKQCKATKKFHVSQPGSVTHNREDSLTGRKWESGSRITCVKCMTFLGMKRIA